MIPQFVDVSQWNPDVIDWQKYKEWSAQGDGISRVAMRSSYGYGFEDTHFAAYRAGALSAGIHQIIFYHYAYPQYNFPVVEANWQKQVVGDIRAQDILALDFEENVYLATSAWAYVWLTQQQFNYPTALPRIYASSYYIQQRLQDPSLAKFPLWLANWQFTPDERPPCPPPWQSYEFVQYTDKAINIPGITGILDANIYLGGNQPMPPTDNQLKAATDSWKSVFLTIGTPPPVTGTGIYQAWLAALIAGKFYGPPLTHEYNSVDWGGTPIVVQEFRGARCEWKDGRANWY